MKFTEFNFNTNLLEGIEAIGFTDATPIQEKSIPAILEGKDIIASAQTGTGKTAAFLLPIIHKILLAKEGPFVKTLIIVPTRELAVQIDQQMQGLSYFTSVSSIAVYGGTDGTSFSMEKQALTEGADVIIGTPGRLIAHLTMGYVKLEKLKYLILDEADRMLDMGFNDDIMKIISFLPKKRQNLLFSATMPDKIKLLARNVLNNPMEISIAVSTPAEKILQIAYVLYENQKIPLAEQLLRSKELSSALVFCSTKKSARELTKILKLSGLNVEDIHSDLDQNAREKVLTSFRSKQLNILVATDILSRGIDIDNIDLILNYDVPNDGEDYIHRIGRTARAEAEGIAITLINEKEQAKFLQIEELLGKTIAKVQTPSILGESPHYNPSKPRGYKMKKKYHHKKHRQKSKHKKR